MEKVASSHLASGAERRLKLSRWIYRAMLLLCVIASLVAIRRIVAIATPATKGPQQLLELDRRFSQEASLTLAHIIPGLLFVLLLPFQFARSFRQRHLTLHRWMGRFLVALGLIIGITALALGRHPVGGSLESAAVYFYDGFFMVALAIAFIRARRREIASHREWMIRANAILLGIATTRPVMGLFFATSPLTGLAPQQFFGIAFWIGFTLTYLAGEAWIRHTRGLPEAYAI